MPSSRPHSPGGVPKPPGATPVPDTALHRLVGGLSLFWLLACLIVMLARLTYPFELEWIEGAMRTGTDRVVAGLPLYSGPSLDYVPLNYPPLYFWLSGLASALIGGGFTPLRLVSFTSALGLFALLALLVRRETGQVSAALFAVGVFAATFRLSGAWLDIGRADTLHLLLVVAGIVALRFGRPGIVRDGAVCASWALAFLAKQSAPLLVAPLVAWITLRDPRRGIGLALGTALLAAAGILALHRASSGWSGYYLFKVAAAHRPEMRLAALFPVRFLIPLLPVLSAAVITFLVGGRRPASGALGACAALLLGAGGSSWALASYRGGYDNVVMPLCFTAAWLGGLAWGAWDSGDRGSRPHRAMAVASLLQLAVVAWNPLHQLPTSADRLAGQRFVRWIESLEAPVLIPAHPYLVGRAGGEPEAHEMAVRDVSGDAPGSPGKAFWNAYRTALETYRWPVIVLDTEDWLAPAVERAGYSRASSTYLPAGAFWTVTGARTRPEWIYIAPGVDPGRVTTPREG